MKKKLLPLISLLLIFVILFSACNGTQNDTGTDTATESEVMTEASSDNASDTETETESDTDTETEAPTAEINFDKQDSIRGRVSFELAINGLEGEVSLLLADENQSELPYYTSICEASVQNGDIIKIEDLVIPKSCKYIKISAGETIHFFEIPIQYRIVSAQEYRFGALSDVHYNRGDYFNYALDFLDGQSIDFVGVAGDLTNNGELEYLQKFNDAIKEREYKVYTTSGNHDTPAVLDGSWLENMNTGITTDDEVVNIAPNGLDFVYKPDKMCGDVFVFLCQIRWSYPDVVDNTEYTILDKSQLEWLEGVLEENKENTVFLFFHTFLSDPNGEEKSAVGNLQTSAGYEYPLPFSYGAADEAEFRLLLKEYKNVVFFSGHSHWMFELESLNENLNISDFDGEYCYMVHVSSVAEPRYIEDDDEERTSMTGEASEGWIVEVYDKAIMLIPVDFIKEIFYTEYMKIIPLV